ncbi:MAG: OadG family protein [Synergistaceae bacterium]|jgi:hypothetical protein|nr:OadG family protein [Synergistaceae bacterium]
MSSIANHFIGFEGGIKMSIVAFCIVFAVIAVLMLVMTVLKYLVKAIDSTKTAGTGAPPAVSQKSALTQTAVPRDQVSAASASDDEDALVALLTAAITASCGARAAILSYTPSQTPVIGQRPTPAWKMAGILNNGIGLRD